MPESLPTELIQRRNQVENLCKEISSVVQDESFEPQERQARITAASKKASIYGLSQPKEYGGLDAGPLESVVVHETLAHSTYVTLVGCLVHSQVYYKELVNH